jgi:hypothetical protein
MQTDTATIAGVSPKNSMARLPREPDGSRIFGQIG